MKNKNGFTLVELLAVIVILAVIMIIAVTAVVPMMTKSRKAALGDEGISLSSAVALIPDLDPELKQYAGGNMCVSLAYLYERQLFTKGIPDGYDGSVYISYDADTKKYDYKFWITNGTYAYMGVRVNEFDFDNAIDYEDGMEFNNCGGEDIDHYISTPSESDTIAPSVHLQTDSDGTTFTQTKKMVISIEENGSGLVEDSYDFKYIMTTATVSSCDAAVSWINFSLTRDNNYKKTYNTSNTTGKYNFYVCPKTTISDVAGNSIEPILYSSYYYVDSINPRFARFELDNPRAINYDSNGNVIETITTVKNVVCDNGTAHCDVYLCHDYSRISGTFKVSFVGINTYCYEHSSWHSQLNSHTYVNKDNQDITTCVQGQDTPCKATFYYNACDYAGNCAYNLYSLSIYHEDITAGYCV